MLVETILSFCAGRLARRYLSFEEYREKSPPKREGKKACLLYIHVPFCEELCPYCCFLRVKMDHALAGAYFAALKKEIEVYRDLGYCFDSVYVGGGTPTIMPEELAEVIALVRNNWAIKQVSIETNPNHLVGEHLRMLLDAGTNRLSVGVQSFDNRILESIERLEKYGGGEEIKERIHSVVGMFETVNVDMIFNFPNQTEAMLVRDLEILEETGAEQVTYYPLMVSDGVKAELERRCGKMDYRRERLFYRLIAQRLGASYSQQSVWCFSRGQGAIDEYILEHDEYVGTGAGSWGYINGTMYSNTFSIERYVEMLGSVGHPIVAARRFSDVERARYDFLLKLLDGALSVSDMRDKYGERYWLYLLGELAFFLSVRAVELGGGRIRLTPRGRYYWVVLMRRLFSVVGDYRRMRLSSDGTSGLQGVFHRVSRLLPGTQSGFAPGRN